MKYIDTKIFGTVALPDSLNDILKIIENHSGKRRKVYLWRGQGDISWPIHSSAYRRLRRTNKKVTEKSMQGYEEYLLSHATHQGYRYEQGRMLSDFELLAKLEHHGAATMLIDCSRNLLTALWFTCSSESNCIGLLFGLHSHYLGGGENEPEERPYKEIFSDLTIDDAAQVWQPPVVSKRIAAQGAQFVYSSVSDDIMGSLCINKKPEAYIAIAISKELKKELLKELLNTFDIRYLTLFPDLDGFGYANSYRFDEYESERW